jgi:hypothetical protein
MSSRRAILVTGSHRSGSTWVGRMMAEAPGLFYIHEPFSVSDPPGRGICNTKFEYWFTYVTPANEAAYYKPIKNMLNLRYDLWGALKSVERKEEFGTVKTEFSQFLKHRLQGAIPLLKDPIAFFSAGWLADRFDMAVVMVIRHPAAFISSIKKLHWKHPFSHFLKQEMLMRDLLYPFEEEIKAYAAKKYPIIDQAILLWRIIHYTMLKYQRERADWIFVRHEDLSREPLGGFQDLFSKVDLEFTPHVKAVIKAYTTSANPMDPDAPVGSETALKRDSKANIWNWKQRLTPGEIEKIKEQVRDIAEYFYSDQDW